ncbi:hypothetical protein BDK51DRAFT_45329 [Blyttiomyces helicus]|uniref:Uncharacterized protein n=1 Tax=Blyttiomyces helicus TaxID=388810 RepID=A0A4P9W6W3_9FUNG|nr:hypothetical protein BDK51DRAFT_45329 [Blyttiomyces helicus]|eukprot:RKO87123.1 hypothetical protein BDK51DRAFT_45329 [Blyttiomyces helicus]
MEAKQQTARNIHDHLIKTFSGKHVVYLICVGYIEGKWIYKFGHSDKGLVQRLSAHYRSFGSEIYLVHVVECIEDTELELMIKHDDQIKKYIHKLIINGERRTELLEFDEVFQLEDYVEKVEILAKNLIAQKDASYERVKSLKNIELQQMALNVQRLSLEVELAKLSTEPPKYESSLEVNALTNISTLSSTPPAIQNVLLETYQPIPSLGYSLEIKPKKNSRGYKIQRIHPNDLTKPVAVYESTVDVERLVTSSSKSGLLRAIENNSIYMGHRWWKVADDLDENVVHDLPETVELRQQTTGYVVKLENDGEIKMVFVDQRAAMAYEKFKSTGTISNAIKSGKPCHHHIFKMFSDCSPEMQNKWLETNELPTKAKANGKRVARYSPVDGSFQEEYSNIGDVLKIFQLGRATLMKAIENDSICKNWKWKFMVEEN